MTNSLFIWIGWALIALGFAGCFVPVIPGPPVAYAALFAALATGDHSSPAHSCLVVAGIATLVATILDYVVPAISARRFNCSKTGTACCFIGTIAGLFFLPFGVVAGPFLGALAGGLISGQDIGPGLKGAFGALLGFLCGVAIKVLCCGYLAYCFYKAINPGP